MELSIGNSSLQNVSLKESWELPKPLISNKKNNDDSSRKSEVMAYHIRPIDKAITGNNNEAGFLNEKRLREYVRKNLSRPKTEIALFNK